MNCTITTAKTKWEAHLIAVYFGKQGIPTTTIFDVGSNRFNIATSREHFGKALLFHENACALVNVLTGEITRPAAWYALEV